MDKKPATKTKYIREKNRDPFPMKYSLKRHERLDLIKDCGINGMVLFEYYLRLASIEDFVITDANAAAQFGWTERTAQRWRNELTKHGWFKAVKYKDPSGNTMLVYYLGREAVSTVRGENVSQTYGRISL